MDNYFGNHMGNTMAHYGSYTGLGVFQLFHFAFMLIILFLSILVLISLRNRNLDQRTKALWVLISFVPLLGPIAFWVINPQEEKTPE